MSENNSQSRLAPGNKLEQYVIRHTISRGRTTEIYRAFHPGFNRDVAIKLFRTGTPHSTDLATCFRQEVQEIVALRHPNIIQIYDSGVIQASCYIVMELIEGTSLRDLIGAHPTGLDRNTLLRLFSQIASALACAHDQQVTHGNIKPDNILLDQRQRPVLTDFNIPCLKADVASDITPAYMAPERVSSGEVSRQTDIYSLGIMLYEMTTGDVPFKGETRASILNQQMRDQLTPPSQIRVGLDPRLEHMILTALAKDPDQRYESARIMLHELDRGETDSEFSTLSLDRSAAQEIRKRKSEILRFQQSRAVDQTPDDPPDTQPRTILWAALGVIGLLIVLAVLAVTLL